MILSFLFQLIISEHISPIIVMYLPISFVVQELSIESRSSLTCGTVLELIEYRPKDLIESADYLLAVPITKILTIPCSSKYVIFSLGTEKYIPFGQPAAKFEFVVQ